MINDHHNHRDIFTHNLSILKRCTLDVLNCNPPCIWQQRHLCLYISLIPMGQLCCWIKPVSQGVLVINIYTKVTTQFCKYFSTCFINQDQHCMVLRATCTRRAREWSGGLQCRALQYLELCTKRGLLVCEDTKCVPELKY